jgi:predicted AAA+ superfamily ATPase
MFRPDSALKNKFTMAALNSRQLSVYRGLLNDSVYSSFLSLLELVLAEKTAPESLIDGYYSLVRQMLNINTPNSFNGDRWQYHLINLVLKDDNPFTRLSETQNFPDIDINIKKAAACDIRNLAQLCSLEAKTVRHMVKSKVSDLVSGISETPSFEKWPGWDRNETLTSPDLAPLCPKTALANKFLETDNWEDLLPEICRYYKENGVGLFGSYRAFHWISSETNAFLQGIEHPDLITFNDLVGYHNQQKIIIDNTEKLIQGLPANNILLYGERGTGKSSTVKALLYKYGMLGLRIVEVSKQDLSDFPQIIQLLRKRNQKFIIFVDDLSFEENDTEYKYLKTLLEGGLEARPSNILIYATSKLSLSDRFGITVTFTSPSQDEYLNIVESLTKQAGLDVQIDELHRLALQWEIRYNGRSGRTARQFVDWLIREENKRLLY